MILALVEPRGPAAQDIADLWWLMLVLGVAVFAVFGWALWHAIRKGPDDDEPASTGRGATRWIVAGGVVLPTVVVLGVLVATVGTMRAIPDEGSADALVVDVVGHRWWWSFEYPEAGVTTANELHLPVDRPVELRLRSDDVIHSFWVPALAGKTDALPDRVNTMVLEADEAGVLDGACAEFCGLQHAKHGLLVVAHPPEEFQAWLDQQSQPAAAPATDAARRGQERFMAAGCGSCHTVDGTDAAGDTGPDLTHVASRRTLGAGALTNTRDELVAWVANPHDAKSGVEMPAAPVERAGVEEIVDYLETLR